MGTGGCCCWYDVEATALGDKAKNDNRSFAVTLPAE